MPQRVLIVLAVFFVLVASAHAQEPTPQVQITQQQLWSYITPRLQSDAEDVYSLFSGAGAGLAKNGATIDIPFSHMGTVYIARLDGDGAASALSYGIASGAYSSGPMLCYFGGKCAGAAQAGVATNSIEVRDDFGGKFTILYRLDKFGSPGSETYGTYVSNVDSGPNRGYRSLFATPQFVTACTNGNNAATSSPRVESESAAREYALNTAKGLAQLYARKGPQCENFVRYLYAVNGAGGALDSSLRGLASDGARATNYFLVSNMTVIDNPTSSEPPPPPTPTPTDPNDRDGDGIPNDQDPTPDGDNPPPTTDPSADPTQEQDYESNCRIINLFCWARWAFTPQVDWAAEFGNLRASMMQAVPFGYVNWLTGLAAGGGSATIPTISMAGVTMDVLSSPVIQWWVSTGRYWLLSLFYVGFFGWVIRAVLL